MRVRRYKSTHTLKRSLFGAAAAALLMLSGGPAVGADEGPVVLPDSSKLDELAAIGKRVRLGSFAERKPGYQALAFSGITDQKLFDDLRDRLERMYLNAGHDNAAVRELSYLAAAIATSGDDRYRTSLEKVVDAGRHVDTDARKHVQKAITLLASYKTWNEIINKPRPGTSWALARAENMLESSDLELKHEGLKRATELRDTQPGVYDVVEQQLRKLLDVADSDENARDVAAWACETLAHSGNVKYAAPLEHAIEVAADSGLRRHCSSALDKLKEPGEKAAAAEAKAKVEAAKAELEERLTEAQKAKLRQLDQLHARGYLSDEKYQAQRDAVIKEAEAQPRTK